MCKILAEWHFAVKVSEDEGYVVRGCRVEGVVAHDVQN